MQKPYKRAFHKLFVTSILFLWGCTSHQATVQSLETPEASTQAEAPVQISESPTASVLSVNVTGDANAYQFSVEVSSSDKGCDQYADWWEVFTEDGTLVYRRILAHSHVNEQPFVRSGGPINIEPDTLVFIRAHMHPGGYGNSAMQGTVRDGFEVVEIDADFAAELERDSPQPTGCAF